MPIRLACYARWKQDQYGIDVDAIESFQLSLNKVTMDWAGYSSNTGTNLYVEIAPLGYGNRYDVEMILREGTTHIEEMTWSSVIVPNVRPFDTGRLESVTVAGRWFHQLHAKG